MVNWIADQTTTLLVAMADKEVSDMAQKTYPVMLVVLGVAASFFIAAANADDIGSGANETDETDCAFCFIFDTIQAEESGGSVAIAVGDSVAISGSNIACDPNPEGQEITQTLNSKPGVMVYSYSSDGGTVINGETIAGDACNN